MTEGINREIRSDGQEGNWRPANEGPILEFHTPEELERMGLVVEARADAVEMDLQNDTYHLSEEDAQKAREYARSLREYVEKKKAA